MYDFGFGAIGIASLLFWLLSALLLLLVWFVVNRASVRANEQIHLLREIAEQQRRQSELLQILVEQAIGQEPGEVRDLKNDLGFKDFIPER